MAKRGRAGAGGDPRLGIDVLDVVAHRLGRDPQRGRHLLVGAAPSDQAQDVDLAFSEARRARHVRWAARQPSGGEHGVDLGAREAATVDLVEQLRRRIRWASAGRCGRSSVMAW
jgi:hypothetical protein